MEKKWYSPQTFLAFTLITICVAFLSLLTIVICIPLIPFRYLRIKICNVYGATIGYIVFFFTRVRLKINDTNKMKRLYPAIYVLNHTSSIDLLAVMNIIPTGTVGTAKREIALIPFFGWLYTLSGHLLLDRKNRERAIKSLGNMAKIVKKYNLGLAIFAEGTRSKDGRFQRFKKGFAHTAMSTKLPIVPVVFHNFHKKWTRSNAINFDIREIKIDVLDPIDTTNWTEQNIEQHVQEVWEVLHNNLSEEQKYIEIERESIDRSTQKAI